MKIKSLLLTLAILASLTTIACVSTGIVLWKEARFYVKKREKLDDYYAKALRSHRYWVQSYDAGLTKEAVTKAELSEVGFWKLNEDVLNEINAKMIQDGYNHAEIDDMYCEADRQALESVKIDKKDKEMGNYHFDIGPYKFIHPETDEMIIKRLQSKTTPSK